MEIGINCPGCHRYTRKYKRKFNAGMARMVIALERHTRSSGHGWIQASTYFKARPELGIDPFKLECEKLPCWDLAVRAEKGCAFEQSPPGMWKLTPVGILFARGEISIPSRIWWFDNKRVAWVNESDTITICDALGSAFDYDELMGTPLGGPVIGGQQ